MYYRSKYYKSLITTWEVAKKFEEATGQKIILHEIETGGTDGFLYDKNTGKYYDAELKQRQDYEIKNRAEGNPKYKVLTVPSSTVKTENELFFIYDLSMEYVAVFHSSAVDLKNKYKRRQLTEIGWRDIWTADVDESRIKYFKIWSLFSNYLKPFLHNIYRSN